jgi:hypothetical protein
MEEKEENYIRQLLLELEDSLFSLKWYDKEDNEIMLKNIIGFDSIFQIIPKRFHKLLGGKIYTQEELDKAREEGREEGVKKYSRFMELRDMAKHTYFEDRELGELYELELEISNLLKTKEDEK